MAQNNIVEQNEELEYDTYVIEEQKNIPMEETVEIIEVSESESYTVESFDAFPAIGESNENLKHQLLNGRELADQHPITSITGLREELDNIEALQTVYSDEKQVADYYEWEDGNILQENRVGLFISLCKDIKKIKVCDGGEIFGVVVDNAALVGGQDDIIRDYKYGLVTYSGVVHVRCESDVKAEDFVISNIYGVAKKSNNNYGCQVIALHKIDGIMYASISLGTSINQIDSIGNELKILDNRMDDAEKNIASAINLANDAYNKASEAGEISEEAIKNAIEAMGKADNAVGEVDKMNDLISSANEVAAQAKAIADSTIVSAVSISKEAVEEANKAVTEASKVKKELDQTAYNMNVAIQGATYQFEALKDDLKPLATWPSYTEILPWVNESSVSTKEIYYAEERYYYYSNNTWNSTTDFLKVGADTKKIYYVEDISTYWYYKKNVWKSTTNPEEAGITSYAGFVAQADEDSAILGTMVGRKGEDGETLAGFLQKAEDTYATVQGIVNYTNKDGSKSGAAGLIAQVDDNQSQISTVANYSFTKNDGSVVTGLAGLNAYVNDNESNVSLVSQRVQGEYIIISEPPGKEEDRDPTRIYCECTNSEEKWYCYYYYKDNGWKESVTWDGLVNDGVVDEAIVYYIAAGKKYKYFEKSWISTSDPYEAGLPSSVAGIQVVTDDNSSKINQLTSWSGTAEESMTRIEQKADDNGASINLMVSSIDKYSVGEYSQAYGLTYDQAKSILKPGMIYIPTEDHSEEYSNTIEAKLAKGYYYEWGINDQDKLDWIEQTDGKTWISSVLPSNSSNIYKYWYIDSNTAPEGYESYALYIWEEVKGENDNTSMQWVKVNTLAGNVNNRITSMIRQTADEIALEVSNTRGSVAALNTRVSETESSVQTVADWKSDVEDDVSNIATIKQTADAAGASVAQVASQICGEYTTINGSWSSTGKNTKKVYYTTTDKKYWYYKNSKWNSTDYPTEAGLQVNAASIVTAINNGESSVVIKAEHLQLDGIDVSLKGKIINIAANDVLGIESPYFSVSTDGYMTAEGGTIGGWKIEDDRLTSTYKWTDEDGEHTHIAGFKNAQSEGGKILAIGLRSEEEAGDWSNAPFWVNHWGKMHAEAGDIGGWIIEDTYLGHTGDNKWYLAYNPDKNNNCQGIKDWAAAAGRDVDCVMNFQGKFVVDKHGVMYATGAVISSDSKLGDKTVDQVNTSLTVNANAISAEVTARQNADSTLSSRLSVAEGNISAKVSTTSGTGVTDGTGWDLTTNAFIVKSIKGGTATNVLTVNSGGLTVNGKIVANGDSTFSGKLSAATGTFKGTVSASAVIADGAQMGTTSSLGNWKFSGNTLYINSLWDEELSKTIYTAFTPNYLYCGKTSESASRAHWDDVIDAGQAYSGGSDLRIKKDIENLTNNYDNFFDLLQAKRYKYIDGTSDRYHTGFIAQEVVTALADSGLDTQQFAGVMLKKPGTEDECWHLRRDEFVALNTWQIQKAKARITELEERVAELERLIKGE